GYLDRSRGGADCMLAKIAKSKAPGFRGSRASIFASIPKCLANVAPLYAAAKLGCLVFMGL
ncbi:MAG: hypothetical protein ACTH8C_15780, partial [Pseudomonas taetrolens]|uniref:hypothetical protein n=1 Tax=Pseudomonas taetrolens TaxID=47884 RepID=UPI003F9A4654